jgi:hypothetical protein
MTTIDRICAICEKRNSTRQSEVPICLRCLNVNRPAGAAAINAAASADPIVRDCHLRLLSGLPSNSLAVPTA